ncbi:hypothetical protein B0H19DRAFT_1271604 [Mycena capillaripes]|nr:hypothetical protein B0H19DRAFT_1271604 [Mycena capillaripes]
MKFANGGSGPRVEHGGSRRWLATSPAYEHAPARKHTRKKNLPHPPRRHIHTKTSSRTHEYVSVHKRPPLAQTVPPTPATALREREKDPHSSTPRWCRSHRNP